MRRRKDEQMADKPIKGEVVCSHCGAVIDGKTCHDLVMYDREYYMPKNGHRLKRCMTVRHHMYLCHSCANKMEDFMRTCTKYISPNERPNKPRR